MKLLLNSLILLLISIMYGNTVYGLSNHQIRAICKKQQNISSCMKKLKIKKLNLLKGNQISIPVVPFKK